MSKFCKYNLHKLTVHYCLGSTGGKPKQTRGWSLFGPDNWMVKERPNFEIDLFWKKTT